MTENQIRYKVVTCTRICFIYKRSTICTSRGLFWRTS